MAVKVDGLEIAVKSTVTGLNSFKSLQATVVKLSNAVEQLTTSLPKMAKQQDKSAKSSNALNKQMTKMESETKKLSAATKKAEGPLAKMGAGFSKIVKSIGRIAFYRAVRSALRAITGAFKEGVENLYQWSKAGEDNGKFAESMDKIATAVKYLKNALATLVAPLINSAAPVIDSIIDTIVAGINKINESIAKLRGDDFWYKAVKVPVEFAEGTKEATAAVKDFMMGWDELNVINDSNGSGSGASSALVDMFDTVKTENPDAGSSLFSKLKSRFNNMIDSFKKKWEEWGLSDTIQKFAEEYLPTIINFIATAATYISEIVVNMTLPALKYTLELIMDILDLLSGKGSFLGNLASIGVDFVSTIVGPLISAIDTIAGWFGLETEGSSIFAQAVDELKKMLKGGLWKEFGALMKNGVIYIWQQIILPTLKLIFGIGGYLFGWLGKWADELHNEFINKITNLVFGISPKDFNVDQSKLGGVWVKFVKQLKQSYSSYVQAQETKQSFGWWVVGKILTSIVNAFIDRTKDTKFGKFFTELLSTIKQGYNDSKTDGKVGGHIASAILTAIVDKLKSKIKEKVSAWTSPFTVFATEFKKAWSNAEKGEDIGDEVGGSIWTALINWWKDTPVGKLADAISAAFTAAFEEVKKLLPDWVKKLFGIDGASAPTTYKPVGSGPSPSLMANGGTPNTGSLFWAGEAGPELVDQVGGRSTVYNAGQLAQELSVANGNVVGAIYGMRDAVVGAIAAKDTTVRISGGDIGRANADYQRKRGVYVNTGAFANAY